MTTDLELAQRAAAEATRMWRLAAEAWAERLARLTPADLARPTPCAEWNVTALVDHTIETHRRYGTRFGYDMGDERDWAAVAARMERGLQSDDQLPTGAMHHSALGETTRLFVLGIVTNDLLVHTWDLARAIGVDDTLPSEVVDACLHIVDQTPAQVVRSPQVWGDLLPAGDGCSPQERLLAAVGRSSRWPQTGPDGDGRVTT